MGASPQQQLEAVDVQLTATVRECKDELKAEVHQIGEQVASIDQRIRPVEADAQRAQASVYYASLSLRRACSTKRHDSLRRLSAFTGTPRCMRTHRGAPGRALASTGSAPSRQHPHSCTD